MSAIRFLTDEDVYGTTAGALRARGFDAVSTPESGRIGQSDEAQRESAAAEGRTLVTFHVAHFAALHSRWMGANRTHAGLIVSLQRPLGELLRRLLHLAATLDADAMKDRLEFLSNW